MFDHAQSPRLGQPTAVENPGVQLCTLETLPEVAYRGQIVYRLDDDVFQVYDGVAWQNPTVYDAGGTQTFVSAVAPVADHVGDLWLSKTDYQLYVWDGQTWQHTTSQLASYESQALLNLAKAIQAITPDGVTSLVRVFYDTQLPLAPNQWDVYCNVTSNEVYQYNGSTWIQQVGANADLINDAGVWDRFIFDGGIAVFFGTSPPSGMDPTDIGDLWIVTSLMKLVRYWTGAQWVDLQITGDRIATGAVGSTQIAQNAVDGQFHVLDSSIVTSKLADNVITNDKLSDFAVAVRNMNKLTHEIY